LQLRTATARGRSAVEDQLTDTREVIAAEGLGFAGEGPAAAKAYRFADRRCE